MVGDLVLDASAIGPRNVLSVGVVGLDGPVWFRSMLSRNCCDIGKTNYHEGHGEHEGERIMVNS